MVMVVCKLVQKRSGFQDEGWQYHPGQVHSRSYLKTRAAINLVSVAETLTSSLLRYLFNQEPDDRLVFVREFLRLVSSRSEHLLTRVLDIIGLGRRNVF